MIIAIDGPAGAGKSTVARRVAGRLGLGYLDTGAMYRAITWLARERGLAVGDGAGIGELARTHPVEVLPGGDGGRIRIDGRDVTAAIRAPDIAADVSEVSAHAAVREAVVAQQRTLLADGDWVAEGRDVGSTVCPGADLKVFLTASLDERARRRRDELAGRGHDLGIERVRDQVSRRDRIDSEREVSPLRVPDGAVLVDSSRLGADEVVERVVRLAEDLLRGAEAGA